MTAVSVSRGEGLASPRQHITYQPRETVERAVQRLLGCRSEGAAHQRILRARAEHALIIEGFLAAGASERLTWFIQPSDTVLSRQVVPPLTAALVKTAAAVDGQEDADLVALAAELDDEAVARTALRDISREITIKEQLRRAICAKHGWQV